MTSNNNEGNNERESNLQNIIQNHLHEIDTIQQETNNHFQSIMRRISEIRNMQQNVLVNRSENDDMSVNDVITLNYCLIFLPMIISAIITVIVYKIMGMVNEYKNDILEINMNILESSCMWSLYFLFYVFCFFIFWFFFLLIHKIITNFDNCYSFREQKLKIEDILLFNPCYNNVVFLYYNKGFLSTNFDFFIIVTLLTFLSFNFIFGYYTHSFLKNKIATIQNKKMSTLSSKITLFYALMIGLNFLSLGIMFVLVPVKENLGPFIFIAMKNVYLFLHQIKLYQDNYISFNQIDISYSNNEKNFIYNQYKILILHLVISFTFACQMIFSAYIFISKNSFFLFLPVVIIIFKSINGIILLILKLQSLYTLLKNVDRKLPLVYLGESDKECMICTDTMENGRKLPCGHFFHLICLLKWMDKGTKKCPLCRKELDLNMNMMTIRNENDFYYNIIVKFENLILRLIGIRSINIMYV